jgi:serine/threonine protein kinase
MVISQLLGWLEIRYANDIWPSRFRLLGCHVIVLKVEILRRLKSSPEHSGKPYIMSMLDHFWIHRPNGKHLCVVSEVGGPSIKHFNDWPGQSSGTRRLRAFVARKVALQATEGLAYIRLNGIVDGGIFSGILIGETSANHRPLDYEHNMRDDYNILASIREAIPKRQVSSRRKFRI